MDRTTATYQMKKEDLFGGDYAARKMAMERLLHKDENFDILEKELVIGGRQACLFAVDGFTKGDISEKVLEFFYSIKEEDMPKEYQDFVKKCTPFLDIMTIARLHCCTGKQSVCVFSCRRIAACCEEPRKHYCLQGFQTLLNIVASWSRTKHSTKLSYTPTNMKDFNIG